ncbi:hypothetical protein VNO77_46374 [Canavalia gladiata]|uniref:Uncharacterized protein n=1 Tax=Canavalia gladiata TaxID=3824 RepID=A0AAN9JIH2_CANGL
MGSPKSRYGLMAKGASTLLSMLICKQLEDISRRTYQDKSVKPKPSIRPYKERASYYGSTRVDVESTGRDFLTLDE